MQDQPDKKENENLFNPIEAWGSIKIKDTRVAQAKAESMNFSVGLWAGIWCAVCMFLAGLLSFGIDQGNALGSDSASAAGYKMGGFIGSGLAVLVMSYIGGWIFWRITGRNRTVGRIIFSMVAGFVLLSQLVQVISTGQREQSIDEAMEAFSQVPVRAETLQEAYPRTKQEIPRYLSSVLSQYDATAAQGNASDTMRSRRFSELRMVLERRLQMEAEYAVVLNGLMEHYGHNPSHYMDMENIDAAISASDAVYPAGEIYKADVKAYPANAMTMVSAEAFPAKSTKGFFRGMDAATISMQDEIDAFVKTNNDFASAGSRMLEMLARNKRKWRIGPDEKYEFMDQGVLDQFALVQDEFIAADSARVAAFHKLVEVKKRVATMPPESWSQ